MKSKVEVSRERQGGHATVPQPTRGDNAMIDRVAGWPGLRLCEGPEVLACHAGSHQGHPLRCGPCHPTRVSESV